MTTLLEHTTTARAGLDVEDDAPPAADPVTIDPLEEDGAPTTTSDGDDGEQPADGEAARGDIPGGAEAAKLHLWVVLTPAGIGQPRKARGPFGDPAEARDYGRELGGGYDVVEFEFATVPNALPGRRALEAFRRSLARNEGRNAIARAVASEAGPVGLDGGEGDDAQRAGSNGTAGGFNVAAFNAG